MQHLTAGAPAILGFRGVVATTPARALFHAAA